MVICPYDDVVDFVSVRHLTTMDVDDMDTCNRTRNWHQHKSIALESSIAKAVSQHPAMSARSIDLTRIGCGTSEI